MLFILSHSFFRPFAAITTNFLFHRTSYYCSDYIYLYCYCYATAYDVQVLHHRPHIIIISCIYIYIYILSISYYYIFILIYLLLLLLCFGGTIQIRNVTRMLTSITIFHIINRMGISLLLLSFIYCSIFSSRRRL